MPDLMSEITAILLATTVALWAYFAFFLGPALWETKRWAFYLCVVIGIGYGWFLTRFLASGWLGQQENATAVEAVAAASQAIFATVLIVLTVLTVRANAKIAEETSVMARETEKIAATAVRQQRAATRPVLVFRIHPEGANRKMPYADRFAIEVVNVGAGPALDTRVFITGPFRYSKPTDYVQPLVIAPQEAPVFTFKLDQDTPFLDDADRMRWPRNDEDAQLEQEWRAGNDAQVWKSKDKTEKEKHSTVGSERWKRKIRYFQDLTAHISRLENVGQIRAEYRGLAGVAHASSADLLVGPRSTSDEDEEIEGPVFNPNWPPITLGLLLLASPLTTAITSQSSLVQSSLD